MPFARSPPGRTSDRTHKKASGCRKSYSCVDGPVTGVDCCANAYGCLTSVSLYHLDAATPPKNASCSACTAADNVTRVALDGELIVGYNVEVKKWGGGGPLKRCITAIIFKTNGGRQLRCGAGGVAAAAVAAATSPVVPFWDTPGRHLLTIPAQPSSAKPPHLPACLARVKTSSNPASVLCLLTARRCEKDGSGSPSLNYIRPLWGHQPTSCAFTPQDVAWSCRRATITCSPAGAAVPLTGLCSTNVWSGAVHYSLGGGAVVAGNATCPPSGSLTVTPMLVAGPGVPAECQAAGPAVLLKLENRNEGTGTTGADSERRGGGLESGSGWGRRRLEAWARARARAGPPAVAGRPAAGGPRGTRGTACALTAAAAARRARGWLGAAVRSPSPVPLKPSPSHPPRSRRPPDSTTGTCPAAPVISCPAAPPCAAPGQPVLLMGSCTASNNAATLVYLVNGRLTLTALCPMAGGAVAVSVTALFAERPACGYNVTKAYDLTSGCTQRQQRRPRRPLQRARGRRQRMPEGRGRSWAALSARRREPSPSCAAQVAAAHVHTPLGPAAPPPRHLAPMRHASRPRAQ